MSELDRKTAEFIQAIINEIVDDCIAIARETPIPTSVWPNFPPGYGYWTPAAAGMRSDIIKRLEEYKIGAVTLTSKRTAA
jgi:hypothetical protein